MTSAVSLIVLATLREHGPMTTARIAETLGWPYDRVRGMLMRERRERPGVAFRIDDFENWTALGQKRPVARYSAEGGKDAVYVGTDEKKARSVELRGLKAVRVAKPYSGAAPPPAVPAPLASRARPVTAPSRPVSPPRPTPEFVRPHVPVGGLWCGLGQCIGEYAR